MSRSSPLFPVLENAKDHYRDVIGQDPDYVASFWYVLSISQMILRELDALVRDRNMSAADILFMGVLRLESAAVPRPTDIARILMVSQAAMTARTSKLVENGLIEKFSDDSDRRSTRLRLTADGARLIDEILAQVAESGSFARIHRQLDPQAQKVLEETLKALHVGMERHFTGV